MSEGIRIELGTDEVLADIRGQVGVVTLNRPAALNAFTDKLGPILEKLIRRFDADPNVRSIVVTGAGSAFCAGGDVKVMAQSSPTTELNFDRRVDELRSECRGLTGALIAARKPTIASMPGVAAGVGLAIALACDFRIAAETAFVTTAFARIASSGDSGVAWLLTRLVGLSRAKELMFLSERIVARRAEALGLINWVVADSDLQSATFTLANKLAEGPSLAFRYMKDNLDHALTSTFLESVDFEAENCIKNGLSFDRREGVSAFAEKRRPAFTGR